jgi:hypothetical protein
VYLEVDMKRDRRTEIRFFVSCAHENDKLATSFIKKFKTITGPSKKYKYVIWRDADIVAGKKWEEEIQKALKECDMGLLLISPEFLISDYIGSLELPKFVGNDAKPVIPVTLLKINFDLYDLKGLQPYQFFLLKKF